MSEERMQVSRREFLIRSAGAGFALGLNLPLLGRVAIAADGADTPADAETPEINAWVVIQPDDTVVIRIARSEMGQGTLTGLAQLVAEELECDWSKVTTEYPTPGENLRRDRVWGSFSTGGSRGIRESHLYVRKGGAVARQMLIEAAADAWGVPASECRAENSLITHGPSGRSTSYGQVAKAAAELWPPEQVDLKDPKDWKLIGQPVKRLDTADKLERQAGLRRGPAPPRHAQCRHQGLPGLHRQARILRCGARCRPCPACARCWPSATTPWPWSPRPGGRPRPRWMPCPSPGIRDRTQRSAAPTSTPCSTRA